MKEGASEHTLVRLSFYTFICYVSKYYIKDYYLMLTIMSIHIICNVCMHTILNFANLVKRRCNYFCKMITATIRGSRMQCLTKKISKGSFIHST